MNLQIINLQIGRVIAVCLILCSLIILNAAAFTRPQSAAANIKIDADTTYIKFLIRYFPLKITSISLAQTLKTINVLTVVAFDLSEIRFFRV